jgi:hypothetical protein
VLVLVVVLDPYSAVPQYSIFEYENEDDDEYEKQQSNTSIL